MGGTFWAILSLTSLLSTTLALHLTYKVRLKDQPEIHTCPLKRQTPDQHLTQEISFDETCFSGRLDNECQKEDIFCHHEVFVESVSRYNAFSLSIAGHHECKHRGIYRLLSWDNMTIDFLCGDNQELDINGIRAPLQNSSWYLLLAINKTSFALNINGDEIPAATSISKTFPRPSGRILVIGHDRFKASGGEIESYYGNITRADLFFRTLTAMEKRREIQYSKLVQEGHPYPWCLCTSEGVVTATDGVTCSDGTDRLTGNHSMGTYFTPEGLYDGIIDPAQWYGYWLPPTSETIMVTLDRPSLVEAITIYSTKSALSLYHWVCNQSIGLVTIPQTSSLWKVPANNGDEYHMLHKRFASPLVLGVFEIQISAQRQTNEKIYELQLHGRPVDYQSPDCNCLPATSEGCGHCGRCRCKDEGESGRAGRNCLPYINTMVPTYGPAEGGTVITMNGDFLALRTKHSCMETQIKIGDADLCQEITRNNHTITCRTRRLAAQHLTGVVQFVTVILPLGDVEYVVKADLNYQYRPNPVLTSIHPKFAFRSGSHQITISGRHLDSIHYKSQKDALKIMARNITCSNVTSSQVMCTLPDLPPVHGATLTLSHSYPDTSGIYVRICETPQFIEAALPIAKTGHLVIKGKHLNSCEVKGGDYRVMVGGVAWPVRQVNSDSITCSQPLTSSTAEASPRSVRIYLFNRIYTPTHEVYQSSSPISSASQLVIPVVVTISVILVLILAALGMYCSFRNNTQPQVLPPAPTIEELTVIERGEPTALDMLEGDLHHVVVERLIDKARLEILELVGRGNFGKVYRGILDGSTERTEVAMKTISDTGNIGPEALGHFLEEATIMRDFQHPNILSLLGVMVDGLKCYVIMPFMSNGDLRSFVIEKEFDEEVFAGLVLDVAKGMQYLGKQKFVHRDLAARNCLVDVNEKVVVGDFGLARDIYHKDYYKAKDKKALPYKWMALEVLEDLAFSIFSDVWAFGVLMWEVFKKGGRPYALIPNQELKAYLQKGNRLDKPPLCAIELYTLMEDCWKANPGKRPPFFIIVKTLEEFLNNFQYSSSDDSSDLTSLSSVSSAGTITTTQMICIPHVMNCQSKKIESEYLLPTKPMPPVPLPRRSLCRE